MADELHRHGCKRNGAERGATRPRRAQRGAPPSQRGKRPAPHRPAPHAPLFPTPPAPNITSLYSRGCPAPPGRAPASISSAPIEPPPLLRVRKAARGSVSPAALKRGPAAPLRSTLTSGRSVTRFAPPQPRSPAPSSGGDPKMAAGPRQRSHAPAENHAPRPHDREPPWPRPSLTWNPSRLRNGN